MPRLRGDVHGTVVDPSEIRDILYRKGATGFHSIFTMPRAQCPRAAIGVL